MKKLTMEKIHERIEDIRGDIEYFESKGSRGSNSDFERLARYELLLGNVSKAKGYFEESDRSWLYYLDHNKDYIKREWKPHDYLSSYQDQILIKYFTYGREKAKEFVNRELTNIESNWKSYCGGSQEESLEMSGELGNEVGSKYYSNELLYKAEIPLFAYLILKDKKSVQELTDEIFERFEKHGEKTFNGKKYPTFLVAKQHATMAKGILERDKELFLKGFNEFSNIYEKLMDGILAEDYANLKLIFYLELAREIWPDLTVDSPLVPEVIRDKSYFGGGLKLHEVVEDIKGSIRYIESKGYKGYYDNFKDLAKGMLLLGNVSKAKEHFRESDKAWNYYLDHRKGEWYYPSMYLSSYQDRILIKYFAYGHEEVEKFLSKEVENVESHWNEWCKFIQWDSGGRKRDERDFLSFVLLYIDPRLYTYLILRDKKSLQECIKYVFEGFSKHGEKTFNGKKYPTFLVAKQHATMAKGILERDKELFLKGFNEFSNIYEKLMDGILAEDYANLKLIFYLELAREIWPDLTVDSPLVPEVIRDKSYFGGGLK